MAAVKRQNSPEYPNILGHPWRHETRISTNENAYFGWCVVFHNKPKKSRWRTNRESRTLLILSNAMNTGLQEVYILAIWVKYCRSYEKRKVRVRIPRPRQIFPDKDYPPTVESTNLNCSCGASLMNCFVNLWKRDTRIGKFLYLAFFQAR